MFKRWYKMVGSCHNDTCRDSFLKAHDHLALVICNSRLIVATLPKARRRDMKERVSVKSMAHIKRQ